MMHLWVGLGNPGAGYAGNRHNIGFMAVDRIAADHGFSPWRKRFQGLAAEGQIGDARMVLLKPGTFMNLSGQSVAEALRFYKLAPPDMMVMHDELDLAPGKVRLKQGGGHAGHNGLRSIHAHVGDDYGRLRFGIGHPGHKDAVAAYVLHDFAKADGLWLDPLLQALSQAAPLLAEGNGPGFLNDLALRLLPPRVVPRPTSSVDKAAPPTASGASSATPAVEADPLMRLADQFRRSTGDGNDR